MLNNEVRHINYNILGYHKKRTIDTNGDLVTVEYYVTYDGVTYSGLKVKETRIYTRDAVTGIMAKRDMTIEWYEEDEVTIYCNSITEKYYTAQEGYEANIRSRSNLITNASLYLFQTVGEVDAKAFLEIVAADIDKYKGGAITPLLTAISGSGETYMTPTIKATLDAILNIVY